MIAIPLLHYCMDVKSNMALYCSRLFQLLQVPSMSIVYVSEEASEMQN